MVKRGCEWQDKCKRDVLAEVGSKHGIEGRRIAFVQGHDLYGSWCGSLFLRKRGGCGQKPERQRCDEQRCQKAYGHESHCGCPSQKCARIVRLLRLLSRAGKPATVATLESGSLGHEERLGSRKAEGSHQSHVVGFGDCACTTVGSTLRNSIGSNNLFCQRKALLQIGMRVIDRYRGLKIENTDRGSRWRM